MIKKIYYRSDWLVFLILPIILAIGAVNFADPQVYKLRWNISIYIIYFILFIKPILYIIGYKNLYQFLIFRRQLGMASFWYAIYHSWFLIYSYWLFSIDQYIWLDNYLFWWVLAIIGMIILAATTNHHSVKKLWKNWKIVQMITYPTFFLWLIHSELISGKMSEYLQIYQNPYIGIYKVIWVLIMFVLIKYIANLCLRKKIPSIYDFINQKKNY